MFAGGVVDGDFHGHFAEGVGGAGEAGVVGSDGGFDAVEGAFGYFGAFDVVFGDFFDGAAHGVVVVARGDEEIDLFDLAVFIDPVLMPEGSAGGFDDANALAVGDAAGDEDVFGEDFGVLEDLLGAFDAVEVFDEAGVVVVEGAVEGSAAADLSEDFEFFLCEWGVDAIGGVEASEGSDAIDAIGPAELLVVGEFEVGPGFDMFGDVVEVISAVEAGDFVPVGIDESHLAIVELEGVVGSDHAEIGGGEGGEGLEFLLMFLSPVLHDSQAILDIGDHGGDVGGEGIAVGGGEGFVDAAGDGEDGVDSPFAESGDDLLAELSEADGLEGELGIGLDDADDISEGGIGIETEEEIGSGEFEEVHGVGLDGLSHVHEFPEELGGSGDIDAEELVAGFDGGEVVANGADAADAFGDLGHFVEESAFAEFFESAELVDVESGSFDVSGVVELDGDFGMSFDASHGFDGDDTAHLGSPNSTVCGTQCQSRYLPVSLGIRPATSSVRT